MKLLNAAGDAKEACHLPRSKNMATPSFSKPQRWDNSFTDGVSNGSYLFCSENKHKNNQ